MQIDTQLGSQVGVAVLDLDRVIELYTEGLGLGPFERIEIDATDACYADGRHAPASWRVLGRS